MYHNIMPIQLVAWTLPSAVRKVQQYLTFVGDQANPA